MIKSEGKEADGALNPAPASSSQFFNQQLETEPSCETLNRWEVDALVFRRSRT
jgi:hypothetical protein